MWITHNLACEALSIAIMSSVGVSCDAIRIVDIAIDQAAICESRPAHFEILFSRSVEI